VACPIILTRKKSRTKNIKAILLEEQIACFSQIRHSPNKDEENGREHTDTNTRAISQAT
jgi:hypothetical protein